MKKIWMVWKPDRDGSMVDSFWDTKEAAELRLKELSWTWQVDEYDVNVPLGKIWL